MYMAYTPESRIMKTETIQRPGLPVVIRRKQRTVTEMCCDGATLAERQAAYFAGIAWGLAGKVKHPLDAVWITIRLLHSLGGAAYNLLTLPDDNLKLKKGYVPSIGLTCQAAISRLADGTWIENCPHRGECTKLCLGGHGKGTIPHNVRARNAKSELFATEPLAAMFLLGRDLGGQIRKYGNILFRPDVNQEYDWNLILGDAFQRTPGMTPYGYKKDVSIMDGYPTGLDYVAYSFNEASDWATVERYLFGGGNTAVVTNRKKGGAVRQWHPTLRVVDAGKSDEWMIRHSGVIGDLPALGRARRLLDTGFVQNVYG